MCSGGGKEEKEEEEEEEEEGGSELQSQPEKLLRSECLRRGASKPLTFSTARQTRLCSGKNVPF